MAPRSMRFCVQRASRVAGRRNFPAGLTPREVEVLRLLALGSHMLKSLSGS